MKKINLLLASTVLTTGAIMLQTSCDTRESSSGETLIPEINGQPRGLDLATMQANPADIGGFPFSLVDGESIDFTPTGGNRIVNLTRFLVAGSNVLREDSNSPVPVISPVNPGSFLFRYQIPGDRPITGVTQSTETTVNLILAPQHAVAVSGLDMPQNYVDLFNSSQNPGSLYNAYRENICDGGTIAELQEEQHKAMASIGIHSVRVGAQNTEGPDLRVSFGISLTITSTNQQILDTNTITGTYQANAVYYTLNGAAGASADPEAIGCELADTFMPTVVPLPPPEDTQPRPTETMETGTFVINLNSLLAQP